MPPKHIKLFIGVPCYGQVPAQTVVSFMALLNVGLEYDYKLDWVIGDSLVSRARNTLTAKFRASDCTHMLQIDSDLIFSAEQINRLVAHDVDIVGGFYPKKQDGETAQWVCNALPDFPKPDENGLQSVAKIGTGFLMVKREVFDAMIARYGESIAYIPDHGGAEEHDLWPVGVHRGADGKGRYLSEDWFFCQRAIEMGYKVYGDPKVILRHLGTACYPLMHQAEKLRDKAAWTTISGWFTEQDAQTYSRIAKEIPAGGTFVEVGSWMGRSMCAMLEFLKGEQKTVEIHAVDTFAGTTNEPIHAEILAKTSDSLRSIFERNVREFGGEPIIHQGDSSQAAIQFYSDSINAVFIDADHTYDAVRADVAAWLPKVKAGGIVAGHDYNYPEVRKAVHELIPESEIETIGCCWFHRKAA